MDTTGIIVLTSLVILMVFDFLNLKKLKIPIKKCLTKAAIVFIVNFFLSAFLSIILSLIFESSFSLDDEVFIIIGTVLVLIINYFRIKDRVVKNNKIISKEDGTYEKLIVIIFILAGLSLFIWLAYVYIIFSFAIWGRTPSYITFGSVGGLGGNLALALNNVLFYMFGSFAYKIGSIILFLSGAFLVYYITFFIFAMSKETVAKYFRKFLKK